MTARFPLGQCVMTNGVMLHFGDNFEAISALIRRHVTGDWGDLDPDDWEMNEAALDTDTRLLSAYQCGDERVYVITEADRSVTTVLLASEY